MSKGDVLVNGVDRIALVFDDAWAKVLEYAYSAKHN